MLNVEMRPQCLVRLDAKLAAALVRACPLPESRAAVPLPTKEMARARFGITIQTVKRKQITILGTTTLEPEILMLTIGTGLAQSRCDKHLAH